MTADGYRAIIRELGLSQVGAAKLLGVNPRTSRRWALGEQDIPRTVEIALELMLLVGRQKLVKQGVLPQ